MLLIRNLERFDEAVLRPGLLQPFSISFKRLPDYLWVVAPRDGHVPCARALLLAEDVLQEVLDGEVLEDAGPNKLLNAFDLISITNEHSFHADTCRNHRLRRLRPNRDKNMPVCLGGSGRREINADAYRYCRRAFGEGFRRVHGYERDKNSAPRIDRELIVERFRDSHAWT